MANVEVTEDAPIQAIAAAIVDDPTALASITGTLDPLYLAIDGKPDTAVTADVANALSALGFTAPTALAGADMAVGDLILVYDVSAGAVKTMTKAELLIAIT